MSDIEKILESIRLNSVVLAKHHRSNYFSLKGLLKYYRLPIIIISSLNSIISIGTQSFLDQKITSIINCMLSIICSIIGSIELYFKIDMQMQAELKSNQDYYILSIDIYKHLSLHQMNRNVDDKIFLDESYSRYVKLYEISYVVMKKIIDELSPKQITSGSNLSLNSLENSIISEDIVISNKS